MYLLLKADRIGPLRVIAHIFDTDKHGKSFMHEFKGPYQYKDAVLPV